jgi:hypothetical protein
MIDRRMIMIIPNRTRIGIMAFNCVEEFEVGVLSQTEILIFGEKREMMKS